MGLFQCLSLVKMVLRIFILLARHFEKYSEPTGCFKHKSFALQVSMIE